MTGGFFQSLYTALTRGGGLTIFSDNRRYCQSLARTLGGLREGQEFAGGGGGARLYSSSDSGGGDVPVRATRPWPGDLGRVAPR